MNLYSRPRPPPQLTAEGRHNLTGRGLWSLGFGNANAHVANRHVAASLTVDRLDTGIDCRAIDLRIAAPIGR